MRVSAVSVPYFAKCLAVIFKAWPSTFGLNELLYKLFLVSIHMLVLIHMLMSICLFLLT